MGRTMSSQKEKQFINVYFPEVIEIGAQFENWPHHITLMPWYVAKQDVAKEVANETSRHARPFRVKTGEKKLFGPDNDVPVYEIVPKHLISALHHLILDNIESKGANLINKQYCGESYRPHITIQDYEPFPDVNAFLVDNITVVEKLARGVKHVVHVARIYE